MTADEAKAVIDELVARGAVPAVIGVAITGMLDELQAWRCKREEDNAKAAARMQRLRSRTFANVREQPPDASRTRTRSSSILEEEKIGGGDDARAQGSEKISLGLARPPIDLDDLTTHIEAVVKEHGRWPPRQTEGWNHAVNVSIVDRLLREGVAANTILDAVRIATARSPYQYINGFNFFSGPIARAHSKARAQLQLPLNNSNNVKIVGGRKNDDIKRRIAAAKQAEASARERSDGDGSSVDPPVDTAIHG
jgi:hypothetical protein